MFTSTIIYISRVDTLFISEYTISIYWIDTTFNNAIIHTFGEKSLDHKKIEIFHGALFFLTTAKNTFCLSQCCYMTQKATSTFISSRISVMEWSSQDAILCIVTFYEVYSVTLYRCKLD